MMLASHTVTQQQFSWTLPIAELVAGGCRIIGEIAERHAMKASLGELSPKDLRDIGLTENDVTSIDYIPLPLSGASELSKLSKSRSINW